MLPLIPAEDKNFGDSFSFGFYKVMTSRENDLLQTGNVTSGFSSQRQFAEFCSSSTDSGIIWLLLFTDIGIMAQANNSRLRDSQAVSIIL